MHIISILLIEDEPDVVDFVKKGLGEESFEVSVALNGKDGLEMVLNNPYDIVLLDIMIPEKNGIEVCKEIREHGIQTPILFLTALNTPDNIALGLNSGADDYLVKPFKFNELIARINAILRRINLEKMGDQKPHIKYFLSNLVLDDDAKKVTRNGIEITLTATEYRLLFTLLKNKGKVLSRMDLLENAWDINFNVGTNVVDVYINYLRKKIDTDFEPKLIHTAVGMGYILKES
ncbi:response regulator transcription factor [Aquirufa sp.]|jgi:DNA-binding response OmpR family regulator|uniref:response regulator transcription factor n=1 Tax=Aquirufa sp. TaxID=2676249 RepID=UPI0037C0A910